MKNTITILLTFLTVGLMGQSSTVKKVIYFDISKFELTKEQNSDLNLWVDSIGTRDFEFSINGYADTIGTSALNLKYSKLRAQSVAEFFKIKLSLNQTPEFNFYGEEVSPFGISNEKQRCVVINLTYKDNVYPSNISIAENQAAKGDSIGILKKAIDVKQKFENDTVLKFPKGTQIEIDAETFYPVKIEDIRFEVKEIYNRCDMLKNNTTTRSRDGDCLFSAGMLYVKAMYDGVEIQPNKEKYVRIKLPTNGKVIDKQMAIYANFKDKNGEIIWDKIHSAITYNDEQTTYYLFKTDTLFGFNLDKSIGVKCTKNGPIVKIPKLKEAIIVQLYSNENYLAIAEQRSSRTYALDELKFDNEPFLVIIGKDKYEKPFMAHGYIKDLPKRNWLLSKKHIVKKEYFEALIKDYTGRDNLKDYMCEVLNQIE